MNNNQNLTFEELAVTAIKGEKTAELVAKLKRKAVSAIKAQISLQESNLVDLEERIDDAKAAKNSAIVNGGRVIDNNTVYVQGIIDAEACIIMAEGNLDECKATIKLLEDTLSRITGSESTTQESAE